MAKYYPWNRNNNVVRTIELSSKIIVIVSSDKWLSDFPDVPFRYKYKSVIMYDNGSEEARRYDEHKTNQHC